MRGGDDLRKQVSRYASSLKASRHMGQGKAEVLAVAFAATSAAAGGPPLSLPGEEADAAGVEADAAMESDDASEVLWTGRKPRVGSQISSEPSFSESTSTGSLMICF